MKKIILSLLLAMPLLHTQAQVKINTYAMYAFPDSFDSTYDYGKYYRGQIQDGLLWGGGLEFPVRKGMAAELSYLRLDTNAPTQYILPGGASDYSNLDVAENYIMLGGIRSMRKSGSKVEGFFGGMAGVCILDVTDPSINRSRNFTKFAWGLKGGATVWATEKVGLKLQAQLLSVVQYAGGGFYIGSGGSGGGVSFASSLYQFSLGGGLTFNLGE